MTRRTVAGIGCRRGAGAAEVLAAVEAARAGRVLDALAVVALKADEPGIVEAARRLGLPLLVVPPAAATAAVTATRSVASLAATGTGSASEAAALGAAGPGGRLVAPRLALGRVTCALAIGEGA